MQLYFDLCSEEYHLYKTGFIPEDVWKNWKEGMAFTSKASIYPSIWKKIREYYSDEGFVEMIENEILPH